jgi:hypothetical protein
MKNRQYPQGPGGFFVLDHPSSHLHMVMTKNSFSRMPA